VRQVAGDGEHNIVALRIHALDLGAKRGPERSELVCCRHIVRRAALLWRQDAPAAVEEARKTGVGARFFRARNGVAGNDMDVGTAKRAEVARDIAFHGANIREDGAGLHRSDAGASCRPHRADGDAVKHDVGIGDGIRDRRGGFAETDFAGAGERLNVAVEQHNFSGSAALPALPARSSRQSGQRR